MKYLNKKIQVLVLLLSTFSSVSSSGQVIQKENNDSIEIRIKEIRNECDRINMDTAKFRIVQKDLSGHTTEGGLTEMFYDVKTLRKAILTFYGETGKSTSEGYFFNEQIIFIYEKEVRYKSPIYMEKTEITSQEENRFYFKNKMLMRWVTNDGTIMHPGLYPEKQKEILEYFNNILLKN